MFEDIEREYRVLPASGEVACWHKAENRRWLELNVFSPTLNKALLIVIPFDDLANIHIRDACVIDLG